MRVAVVTPYHNESTDILRRCHNSVINQSYRDVTHIMVADGDPHPWCSKQPLEHMVLPCNHSDAGATPRAIGALSAFGRGYDAVAFLDADNWYEPTHIETMVRIMGSSNVDAVIATRRIYSMDGSMLYVDDIESHPNNDFIDTNCWFLSKRTSRMMGFWVTDPSDRLVSDKVFYQACKANGLSMAHSTAPTVAYVTRWAWHYQQAGVDIPGDAVWMMMDADRNHIQVSERDKGRYVPVT